MIISVLIGVLIIVVVGAICFWAIEKFATDRRLAKPSQIAGAPDMPRRNFATRASADLLGRSAFAGVLIPLIRWPI